jgi:hypothetical protein
MACKFGNYLFKNLKGQSVDAPQKSDDPQSALMPLEEHLIELQEEDFPVIQGTGASLLPLNWTAIAGKGIQVRLKDTCGIMEGRVSISAGVLRKIEEHLVDSTVPDDVKYPVSLKTVVLQIQGFLKRQETTGPAVAGPDFDTPIAQVAREDEGFFKLEKATGQGCEGKQIEEGMFPLIREKPISTSESLREEPRSIPVSVSSLESSKIVEETPKTNLFSELPKVGGKRPHKPARKKENQPQKHPDSKPSFTEAAISIPLMRGVEPERRIQAEPGSKPLRRIGLERLQEIFMTDDFLDAQQVATMLGHFPKVKGVLIMLEDGSLMGGELPPGLDVNAALVAPGLLRAVREFGVAMGSSKTDGVTLLSELQLSLFMEGQVCILLAHEGRGLLPGMRDRMTDIARALSAMYDE